MMSKYCFEAVDRTFKDICRNQLQFGGKPFLMGGDFRQIPPVVLHASPTDIIRVSLKKSYLWGRTEILRLERNMRLQEQNEENEYAEFLLRVGDNTEGEAVSALESNIRVPRNMIPVNPTLQGLIDEIFPDVENQDNPDYYVNRAILTTTNAEAEVVNTSVGERLPGEYRTYLSADTVEDMTFQDAQIYTNDFLNSISPNGIPPHSISLKVGMPIMLIRTLSSTLKLYNGTRLIVTGLTDNLIHARILVGKSKGLHVCIPRMDLSPANTTLPFKLIRRQFPVKACFAMTINKSQGQSLGHVGIYLMNKQVFGHGQLYVALSRTTSVRNIKILSPENIMRNIVFSQLL